MPSCENGKVNTVRYEQINAMLLNEFLKEHRKVEAQDRKIQDQGATIGQLKEEMKLSSPAPRSGTQNYKELMIGSSSGCLCRK